MDNFLVEWFSPIKIIVTSPWDFKKGLFARFDLLFRQASLGPVLIPEGVSKFGDISAAEHCQKCRLSQNVEEFVDEHTKNYLCINLSVRSKEWSTVDLFHLLALRKGFQMVARIMEEFKNRNEHLIDGDKLRISEPELNE